MLWLVVLVLFTILCFVYVVPVNRWKNKDVRFVMPLPFLGNMGKSVIGMDNLFKVIERIYDGFSDERYFVFFAFLKPAVILRDPELVKIVTVKSFEAFPKHQPFGFEDSDPLWSKNLFSVGDAERWRKMRATLSPSFTSNKMRIMFNLMNECAVNLIDYYKDKDEFIKLDVKDMFKRHANDVIASTAFGLTCDSFKDRNNEFLNMGRELTDFDGIKSLKFFIHATMPYLTKVIKISIANEKVTNFFRNLIKENIRIRQESGIIRPDMIHLLMEARKKIVKEEFNNETVENENFAAVEESEVIKNSENVNEKLTDDDITAQAALFFLAGFDTVSTLMSFTAMELAINPEIQNRLTKEIDELYKVKENKPSYEDIMSLKYLDMVISESLRKWPPTLSTDRVCARPFTLEPPREGGKPLHLEKGSNVWIPIYSLHRDERYYPKPNVFDPERFSQENRVNIKPYTYLPFGVGPRNCIGSRFALLEAKVTLYHLLVHFEFVPVKETKLPLELDNVHMVPVPEGGFLLGMKRKLLS